MNILMYALHTAASGYIGGGFVRVLEILKKARSQDINYILIENKPSLKAFHKIDYKGYAVDIQWSPFWFSIIGLLRTVKLGIKICQRMNIDLIISPVDEFYNVLPACITGKLTGIPWTVMLQRAPAYWHLLNGYQHKARTSKFNDLYAFFKREACRRGTPVGPLVAAFAYWVMYRTLRSTITLASSPSIAEDIYKIDKRVRIMTTFPGYSVDYDRIFTIPTESKEYAAIFPSLSPYKGIFDVIKVWSLVAKKRPDARLALVGVGSHPLVQKILDVVRKRGLEDNVLFPCDLRRGAKHEELWSLMKKSKILIYPTRAESWSLVIGEALACGLPVATYDIQPIRYAYGNCPAVFRIQVGDIRNLAKKVLELIENESLYKSVSNEALAYITKYHTWNDVIKAEKITYLRFLHELKK